MAYNSHYLLLLTIPAVVCLFSDLPSAVLGSGVWQVVDPNDPEVLANAKFSIDEHNKVPEPKLLFESIFKAEKQVLEKGTIYRIVIRATKSTGSIISQRDFLSSLSLFATIGNNSWLIDSGYNSWLIDSGYVNHMTSSSSLFIDKKPVFNALPVHTDESSLHINHRGFIPTPNLAIVN
ncbi:hypothetical protein ACH5RR_017479 [Cinchona calisaya]|uniref:Cystatin domain-containing protein n=1 Tax=Cinchona calisaya TaxID=153742 RepID=A0ABD2ZMA4_9GENT